MSVTGFNRRRRELAAKQQRERELAEQKAAAERRRKARAKPKPRSDSVNAWSAAPESIEQDEIEQPAAGETARED